MNGYNCSRYARTRSSSRRDVQLPEPPATGAPGSSVAADTPHDRPSTATAFAAVRADVCRHRSPLDRPGEAAAGLAAAGALHHPQRTDADGATRLQPPVPVVCGTAHGQLSNILLAILPAQVGVARWNRPRPSQAWVWPGTDAGKASPASEPTDWRSSCGHCRWRCPYWRTFDGRVWK